MKGILRAVAARAVGISFWLFAWPLLWLIEPFWRIRIGVLLEDRIGHLAVNTDVFMRRMRLSGGMPPRTSFVFMAWNPANRTLLEMWKRHLTIIESRWLRRASLGFVPQLQKTRFYADIPSLNTSSQHLEFSVTAPTLTFTAEEEEKGRRYLAEMGIGPDDWFICFHSRDPAYLTQRAGFGAPPSASLGSYRDCSIETYLPAARWAAENGGFAIRVGSAADQALPDLGPRVIDYANRFRSDFMDIYLAAKCRYFLGNTSGIIVVPLCFNRPIGGANYVTYEYPGFSRHMLFIPKLLRRREDGRLLTFPEIAALDLFSWPASSAEFRRRKLGETYDAMGLDWVDNSGDEILDLARSVEDMIAGTPTDAEAAALQAAYAAFYQGTPHDTPHAARLCPRFALRHRDLILGVSAVKEACHV